MAAEFPGKDDGDRTGEPGEVDAHGRRIEGAYVERDLGDVSAHGTQAEGEYTDMQEQPNEPADPIPDDGEYTDRDVAGDHRDPPVEGSYTDMDVPE